MWQWFKKGKHWKLIEFLFMGKRMVLCFLGHGRTLVITRYDDNKSFFSPKEIFFHYGFSENVCFFYMGSTCST